MKILTRANFLQRLQVNFHPFLLPLLVALDIPWIVTPSLQSQPPWSRCLLPLCLPDLHGLYFLQECLPVDGGHTLTIQCDMETLVQHQPFSRPASHLVAPPTLDMFTFHSERNCQMLQILLHPGSWAAPLSQNLWHVACPGMGFHIKLQKTS